jgi:hypothetical protein
VFLYKLPNSCIALLFGITGAVLFTGALFLRAKLLRIQINSDHARRAHDALAVVIGFAGLLLAFSLVQEQTNFRDLEAQVGTEANNLAQLDRLLVRYGSLAGCRKTASAVLGVNDRRVAWRGAALQGA